MDTPWLKQDKTHPLFPDLEWSRPENRQYAGKLLVVGGSSHGFAAPAEAFAESLKAGVGTPQALLPDAIKKLVGIIIYEADFAPSTPSGSFSQRALAQGLESAAWADGMLIAGDLSRNSETAIFMEKLLSKTSLPTTITKDAVDYVTAAPQTVLVREQTALVLSLAQLQRLGTASKFEHAITFSMGIPQLTAWLATFSRTFAPHIIVKQHEHIFVAVNGEVSSTRLNKDMKTWRLKTATHASVWWIQNQSNPFAAFNAAVYSLL